MLDLENDHLRRMSAYSIYVVTEYYSNMLLLIYISPSFQYCCHVSFVSPAIENHHPGFLSSPLRPSHSCILSMSSGVGRGAFARLVGRVLDPIGRRYRRIIGGVANAGDLGADVSHCQSPKVPVYS